MQQDFHIEDILFFFEEVKCKDNMQEIIYQMDKHSLLEHTA